MDNIIENNFPESEGLGQVILVLHTLNVNKTNGQIISNYEVVAISF
jgi:hypothetical protein